MIGLCPGQFNALPGHLARPIRFPIINLERRPALYP